MSESKMVSMVRVPESEYLALRQDNERLRWDVEAYRGALGYSVAGNHTGRLTDGTIPQCGMCNSEYRKNLEANLQAHKSLLEVARGVLREWIKFTSITPVFPLNDWFKMREELLSTTNDHLHQINEVLGGDSTKTTEK